MNENLNLYKILKNCPQGMKLYSPLFGDVKFDGFDYFDLSNHCVKIKTSFGGTFYYDKVGRIAIDYVKHINTYECMLFPSETQRDWSKFKVPVKRFDPKNFKPFDKVLVRIGQSDMWLTSFFAFHNNMGKYPICCINGCIAAIAIPYNDETKHLLGTTNDCPEYYKWWKNE